MTLDEAMIVESWSVLVPRAADEGLSILAAIEENLTKAAVPGLEWSEESVSTGLVKGLTGKRRDALVISYRPTPEWRVIVIINPFGTTLHVSWIVLAVPTRARDLRRSVRFGGDGHGPSVGDELDFFDRTDLAAAIAVTRQATKVAIDALGLEEEFSVHDVVPDSQD